MFWFDNSPSGGRIERASLSGQNRKVILSDGVLLVSDIVADVKEQKIFWVEPEGCSIASVNYDGSLRRVVYKQFGHVLFSLALDEVIFKCIGCFFQ